MKRLRAALALLISQALAQSTTPAPTVKLFFPAPGGYLSGLNISASVVSANPCAATYILNFPLAPYCNAGESESSACPPSTTNTISVTAAPTGYTLEQSGFTITANGPSTTSYPEQIFQVCAPATTNTIACTGSARITFPGGSVSTQTNSRTQYFSAMMYDIPVTAGAEKLSSRDGGCSALGTGTALSTVSTTSGQSMTGGPSSAISASSMSSSSSHGAAPTAEVMHLLRLGSLPAAILGAAVLL